MDGVTVYHFDHRHLLFGFRIRTIFRVRNFTRHPFDTPIFHNTSTIVRIVEMRRHDSTDQKLVCFASTQGGSCFSVCFSRHFTHLLEQADEGVKITDCWFNVEGQDSWSGGEAAAIAE